MSIQLHCNFCEKEFFTSLSNFNSENKFYCSDTCKDAFEKATASMECVVCSRNFYLGSYRMKRLHNTDGAYCSIECFNRSKEQAYTGTDNSVKFSRFGDILIKDNIHPFRTVDNYMLVQRLVMENHLKSNYPDSPYLVFVDGANDKFLDIDIVVQHKNGDRLDNRIYNLDCVCLSKHAYIHNEYGDYVRNADGDFKRVIGKKLRNSNSKNTLLKDRIDDAGLDVFSSEGFRIDAKSSVLVSTDLFIAIPENHVGLIWPRSGLSVKHNIEVGAGCIDSSYRGEVKVHLYNHSESVYIIHKGDKIAQLLTIPIDTRVYEDSILLPDSGRGSDGFGSSGK